MVKRPAHPDKITITTPLALTSEFNQLSLALAQDETEHSWEQIDAALKRFHAVVRGGVTKSFPNELVNGLREKDLVRSIVRSMITERTRLSSTTLDLLASLTRLASSFAPLIPIYLPPLLRLLCRTNKLYVQRAGATLSRIIENTKLSSEIVRYIVGEWKSEGGKSSTYRQGGVQATLEMLSDEAGEGEVKRRLDKRVEDLEWVIKTGAVDREPKVREITRKIWEVYKVVWSERVDAFTAPLTPITRRYLAVSATTTSSSSTVIAPRQPPPKQPSFTSSTTSSTQPQTVLSSSTSSKPSTSKPPAFASRTALSSSVSNRPNPPPPTLSTLSSSTTASLSRQTSTMSLSSSTSAATSASTSARAHPPPPTSQPPTTTLSTSTSSNSRAFKPTLSHSSSSSSTIKKAGRAPIMPPIPPLQNQHHSSSLSQSTSSTTFAAPIQPLNRSAPISSNTHNYSSATTSSTLAKSTSSTLSSSSRSGTGAPIPPLPTSSTDTLSKSTSSSTSTTTSRDLHKSSSTSSFSKSLSSHSSTASVPFRPVKHGQSQQPQRVPRLPPSSSSTTSNSAPIPGGFGMGRSTTTSSSTSNVASKASRAPTSTSSSRPTSPVIDRKRRAVGGGNAGVKKAVMTPLPEPDEREELELVEKKDEEGKKEESLRSEATGEEDKAFCVSGEVSREGAGVAEGKENVGDVIGFEKDEATEQATSGKVEVEEIVLKPAEVETMEEIVAQELTEVVEVAQKKDEEEESNVMDQVASSPILAPSNELAPSPTVKESASSPILPVEIETVSPPTPTVEMVESDSNHPTTDNEFIVDVVSEIEEIDVAVELPVEVEEQVLEKEIVSVEDEEEIAEEDEMSFEDETGGIRLVDEEEENVEEFQVLPSLDFTKVVELEVTADKVEVVSDLPTLPLSPVLISHPTSAPLTPLHYPEPAHTRSIIAPTPVNFSTFPIRLPGGRLADLKLPQRAAPDSPSPATKLSVIEAPDSPCPSPTMSTKRSTEEKSLVMDSPTPVGRRSVVEEEEDEVEGEEELPRVVIEKPSAVDDGEMDVEESTTPSTTPLTTPTRPRAVFYADEAEKGKDLVESDDEEMSVVEEGDSTIELEVDDAEQEEETDSPEVETEADDEADEITLDPSGTSFIVPLNDASLLTDEAEPQLFGSEISELQISPLRPPSIIKRVGAADETFEVASMEVQQLRFHDSSSDEEEESEDETVDAQEVEVESEVPVAVDSPPMVFRRSLRNRDVSVTLELGGKTPGKTPSRARGNANGVLGETQG